MPITIEDYIDNPMGGSVLTHRQMYKDMYTEKLNVLMLRENFNYQLFKDESNDTYYIHLKIPSEVVPKFRYDVVFKFSPPNHVSRGTTNLKKFHCRFFSNDPAFVFTFSHVFFKRGLLVDELKAKLPRKAITTAPSEKNPNQQVGYVKSFYFAYLLMNRANLFDANKYSAKYTRTYLIRNVQYANETIKLRQELGTAIEKAEKEEYKAKKSKIETKAKRKTNQPIKTSVKSAPKASKTKSTKRTKRR